LLSHPHRAHAAFADLLQELVRTHRYARLLRRRAVHGAGVGAALQDAGGPLVGCEELLHALAEGRVAGASLVQESLALGRAGLGPGGGEQRLLVHGSPLSRSNRRASAERAARKESRP